MSMRIDLHAKVQTREGADAGHVEGAVIDPLTNKILEVVVDAGGLLARPRLVPFAEIAAAARDGDVLHLRLSRAEVDALPVYSPDQYVVLPEHWVPPTEPGLPAAAYRQPASLAPASATPPGTIYPSLERGGVVHVSDVTQMTVEKGAAVLDRDGDEVGVVDDVRLDPQTGQLMGFVTRVGGALRTALGGGETTEFPRSHIDRVHEGVVHLRLTNEEVKRAAAGLPR